MKRYITIILMTVIFFAISGCYASGMNGTVVDAETGKPIEGAVVLVEWTKRHGIGDYHTESVKVIEVLTDKDGKFKVSGILDPFVDPPDVTVYKKGYVAWNNKYIFPDYAKRTDFIWQNECVFKLEQFKDSYNFIDHELFIGGAAHQEQASEKKKLFINAYDEWERKKVIEERRKRSRPR